jgi:haloalkane dehalogenase
MIRGLAALGHRAVAVDLIGMGRSDKPDDRRFYTVARHVEWLVAFVEAEDLRDITLYCQDWGGIIGLCSLDRIGDRVARVVASNTGLPAGEGVNEFMQAWLDHSQSVQALNVAKLIRGGVTRPMSDAEAAAYDAPFPEPRYQAGALEFPVLIPLQPDNPGVVVTKRAWATLAEWTKPFLTIFGSEDAVAAKPGSHRKLQRVVPGAAGLDHVMIEGANHFIQEDAPDELVRLIHELIAATAATQGDA